LFCGKGAKDVSIRQYVGGEIMRNSENTKGADRGMTFVEMLAAMAITAIVFAAVVPQIRAIQNG
jgi:prepilin-type N-terminal cleavage/methylation domain-containing protein